MTATLTTFERLHADLPTGPLDYYAAGTGKPIVYLHSAGGPRFTSSLEHLAETHTVYVPVAPGFGGTDPVSGISTIEDLGAHYAGFIESLEAEKVDLIGQSFGGWPALHVELAAKGRTGQFDLEAT